MNSEFQLLFFLCSCRCKKIQKGLSINSGKIACELILPFDWSRVKKYKIKQFDSFPHFEIPLSYSGLLLSLLYPLHSIANFCKILDIPSNTHSQKRVSESLFVYEKRSRGLSTFKHKIETIYS